MSKQSQSWFTGYSRVILAVIFTINLSAFLGYSAYGLTFPAMRESLGLSHFQEGTLAASISVSIILSGILTGILASRFQARIIAGLGCILGGCAMIGLGLAPTYPFALAMSSMMGFGMQSGITPGMGLITAWFGAKYRGIASGIGASGGALSFAILGALVPWLTHNDPIDGWRHSWLCISLAAYVAGFMSLFLLKEKESSRLSPVVAALSATVSDAYRNRYIWLISGLAFSSGWASSIQVAFFGEYLGSEGITLEISGRLWWILGFVGIGSGVFWGYLSDRIGRGLAFLFSFIVYGLGLLLFLAVPSLLGFIIGIGLIGMSLRAAYTLCGASVGDYVQEHHAAAAFGVTAMGAGIGLTIAPPVAGVTADLTGNLAWVYVIALMGTVLGLCGSSLLASARPRTDRAVGK